MELSQEQIAHIKSAGQTHLLDRIAMLTPADRVALLADIQSVDFGQLAKFLSSADTHHAIKRSDIAPPDVVDSNTIADRTRLEQLGLAAIQQGKVAVLIVAGGQGTRLGRSEPKGMFPIGPVSEKSLFQLFAEQIKLWEIKSGLRQAGKTIPWLLMTSKATHDPTIEYFQANQYFGLQPDQVKFFQQATMPAVDLITKEVLFEEMNRLALSPNGHGGVLEALKRHQLFEELARRGIETISYLQVDNAFAKVIDPFFIGLHRDQQAEYSLKVVEKRDPKEGLGLIARTGDRFTIIEYSDLPDEIAFEQTPSGKLTFSAGSIGIHVFAVPFLQRMADQFHDLPIHMARKRVDYVNQQGEPIKPTEPNALKFERFIFDTLPYANKVAVLATERDEEFMPLKNKAGNDTAESVHLAMRRRATNWLRAAGCSFEVDQDGLIVHPVEISPLFALTLDEFVSQSSIPKQITGPTYLSPNDK